VQFDLGLGPKLQRHQLARPVTDAIGDAVPGDVEDAAVIECAADEDVGVGMAGVVVIDSDPVELRAEILLHLPHQVAGEAFQVVEFGGVLGRDDETELVAVLAAAVEERLAVGLVFERRIGAALVAVARHPIAFEIAQMRDCGAGRNAAPVRAARALPLSGESHHPRLDHDAARAEAADGIAPPAAAVAREGGRQLRASAARIEPAASASLPAHPSAVDPGAAAGLAGGDLHLGEEGQVADVGARPLAAGASRFDAETVVVSACHERKIGMDFGPHKTSNAAIEATRRNGGHGA